MNPIANPLHLLAVVLAVAGIMAGVSSVPESSETDNDLRVEINGLWVASLIRNVIGTGDYRHLLVQCVGQTCWVNTVDGQRRVVGNTDGRSIFRDRRDELGPFRIEIDNSGFTFKDEKGELQRVVFQRKEGRLSLLYGTHRLTGDRPLSYYRQPSN